MRLHRFYITEPVGTRTEVMVSSVDAVHQIKNVFRLKKGDGLVLFDGSGSDYECEIVEGGGIGGSKVLKNDRKTVTLRIVSVSRSRFVPSRKIFLCAAIVKKDNFEFIAEKATELGVTDIIPVMAERSEKKNLNEGRLKKIVVEASEQSGRGDVPVVHEIVSLDAVLENFKKQGVDIVVFHTEDKLFDKDELTKDAPIAVFIGPEGGWSPAEFDMFHKNSAKVRCLGPQVLRAETAVVAALSQVVF